MAEISDQGSGRQTPRSNTGFGLFLLKALVLFVVIAGGVALGYVVAARFGVSDRAQNFDIEDPDMFNKTLLRTGEKLPSLEAWIEGDSSLVLPLVQHDRKTILAFVSGGCEPCEYVVTLLDSVDAARSSSLHIILLAEEPEDFYYDTAFDLFRVDPERVSEFGIQAFPTVIGVDEDGTISFVSSGFSRTILNSLIDRYL